MSGPDLAERGQARTQGPFYAGCRNTGTFGLGGTAPDARPAVELASSL